MRIVVPRSLPSWTPLAVAIALLGCHGASDSDVSPEDESMAGCVDQLGAHIDESKDLVCFSLYSSQATRVELWVYPSAEATEPTHIVPMQLDASVRHWRAARPLSELAAKGSSAVYYGYRLWGPNWTHVEAWAPGSDAGFIGDVDVDGNRFNPNKLLLDPYARELSSDPIRPEHLDGTVYASGPEYRLVDSGPMAPRSIAMVPSDLTPPRPGPERRFGDEIVYEVHLRGLTMLDPEVPEPLRGTYAGAALAAPRLAALGVTAIELLPIQETQNEQNDLDPMSTTGDNYWGYMTLAFFAPERRYAYDQSPGGPTRELAAMVDAFHAEGIKVYLDVVYNHSGEGGAWSTDDPSTYNVQSFRGIDNPTYYSLTLDRQSSWDNSGVGGNLNTANPVVQGLIVDSLAYFHEHLGIDGFRFDLASILGNACHHGCFRYERDGETALTRVAAELPVRNPDGGAGIDLIGEPWAIGAGTYQLGNMPSAYAEWNADFRDTIRKSQNRRGVDTITPGMLAHTIAGSPALFEDDDRTVTQSINFMVAHDGLTHADLYRCNGKNNHQAWPFGPSDGGADDNNAWDHGGDRDAQERALRTGMGLLLLSAGVPMMTGGDEFARSLNCNNNPYNLDGPGNWIEQAPGSVTEVVRTLASIRRDHPALRPARSWSWEDANGNGRPGVQWLAPWGGTADAGYMDDGGNTFLGWMVDGEEYGDAAASLWFGYQAGAASMTAAIPSPPAGTQWYLLFDSCEPDPSIFAQAKPMIGKDIKLCPDSLVVLAAH